MNGGESQQKSVRFAQLVKEVGNPVPYTLWSAPEDDPVFQNAIRENRVMTVIQRPTGTAKEFGLVGFQPDKNASYLVFPNGLQAFAGKKVVGLKYDLVAEAKPVGPVTKPESPKPTASPKNGAREKPFQLSVLRRPEAAEKPKEKKRKVFVVALVVTTQREVQETVEAENQNEAKRLAEEKARQQPEFALSGTRFRVSKIKPMAA